MKLYAIRNKKTGEYYMEPDRIIPDKDEVFAATTKEWAIFKRRLEDMKDTHEIISFCIEPTEPCDKCKSRWYGEFNYKDENSNDDWKTLMANEWKCCPNCGRSLK